MIPKRHAQMSNKLYMYIVVYVEFVLITLYVQKFRWLLVASLKFIGDENNHNLCILSITEIHLNIEFSLHITDHLYCKYFFAFYC